MTNYEHHRLQQWSMSARQFPAKWRSHIRLMSHCKSANAFSLFEINYFHILIPFNVLIYENESRSVKLLFKRLTWFFRVWVFEFQLCRTSVITENAAAFSSALNVFLVWIRVSLMMPHAYRTAAIVSPFFCHSSGINGFKPTKTSEVFNTSRRFDALLASPWILLRTAMPKY